MNFFAPERDDIFSPSPPGFHLGRWPAWLAGAGYALHGEPRVGLDVWGTPLPLLRCSLDQFWWPAIKAPEAIFVVWLSPNYGYIRMISP